MPETQQLLIFMLAGVLLNLTPGPDVLYIVNRSLRGGLKLGLVAAWGITAGCCVHVAAAALGLGALLNTSVDAFNLIKWLGAAYLLWMGVRLLWRQTKAPTDSDEKTFLSLAEVHPAGQFPTKSKFAMRDVFFGAFATNVLNPKVALFFLAFVPQFIPAQAPDPTVSFLLLGGLFNVNSWLVSMGWACVASWFASRSSLLQRGMHYLDRLTGLMFIGFGLKLAWTDAPVH